MIVVEHPPVRERVAQLHDTGGDGVSLEVVLLAVDGLQLSGLVAVALLADEHLDLGGEAQEAGVEVAGDPMPAGVGDAGRRLGGVVALMLAEQHHLGAVILAAQQPWLVLLVEWSPVVGVAVWPALGFESPAAVGVSLEAHQRALSLVPGAVFESVRVAGAGGDLRADAEVAGGGLLAAAGGQLVDVAAQLLGGHPGAGVCHRQLAHPAARGVEALPVQVPDDAAAGGTGLRGDCVEPVDGELAQALQVGAFAAEAFEQEGGVRDGEVVPAVIAVRRFVVVGEVLGHPCGQVPGRAAKAPLSFRISSQGRRRPAPPPRSRTGR